MKNLTKTIATSFAEQGIASAGNFAFFFLSARLLGPGRFGAFCAAWVAVQFFWGLAIAWVYLPMNSMRTDEAEHQVFLGLCVSKMLRLCGLTVLLLPAAVLVSVPAHSADAALLALAVVLGVTALLVEFSRSYLIRVNHKSASIALLTTKWIVAAGLLVALHLWGLLSSHNAMACLCLGNLAGMGVLVALLKRLKIDLTARRDGPIAARMARFARPLLVHNLAGALAAIILARGVCSWIGVAAYGAYQAARALCNVASPLMQMADTHYSSYLLRRRTAHLRAGGMEYLVLGLGLVASGAAWLARGPLIGATIGAGYRAHAALLPIIVVHTTVLLASRLVAARLRVAGRTRVFYANGLVGLVGTAVLGLAAAAVSSIEAVATVTVLVAAAQFALLRMSLHGLRQAGAKPGEALPPDLQPAGQ